MAPIETKREGTDWRRKSRNWRTLTRFSRSCGGTAQCIGWRLTRLCYNVGVRIDEMTKSKHRSKLTLAAVILLSSSLVTGLGSITAAAQSLLRCLLVWTDCNPSGHVNVPCPL